MYEFVRSYNTIAQAVYAQCMFIHCIHRTVVVLWLFDLALSPHALTDPKYTQCTWDHQPSHNMTGCTIDIASETLSPCNWFHEVQLGNNVDGAWWQLAVRGDIWWWRWWQSCYVMVDDPKYTQGSVVIVIIMNLLWPLAPAASSNTSTMEQEGQ